MSSRTPITTQCVRDVRKDEGANKGVRVVARMGFGANRHSGNLPQLGWYISALALSSTI